MIWPHFWLVDVAALITPYAGITTPILNEIECLTPIFVSCL